MYGDSIQLYRNVFGCRYWPFGGGGGATCSFGILDGQSVPSSLVEAIIGRVYVTCAGDLMKLLQVVMSLTFEESCGRRERNAIPFLRRR